MEGLNNLVSELAIIVAQEKAMLDKCEALLASAAARQVRVIIVVQEHEFCTLTWTLISSK